MCQVENCKQVLQQSPGNTKLQLCPITKFDAKLQLHFSIHNSRINETKIYYYVPSNKLYICLAETWHSVL